MGFEPGTSASKSSRVTTTLRGSTCELLSRLRILSCYHTLVTKVTSIRGWKRPQLRLCHHCGVYCICITQKYLKNEFANVCDRNVWKWGRQGRQACGSVVLGQFICWKGSSLRKNEVWVIVCHVCILGLPKYNNSKIGSFREKNWLLSRAIMYWPVGIFTNSSAAQTAWVEND